MSFDRPSSFAHCAFKSDSFSVSSPARPARFRRPSISSLRRPVFSFSCSTAARVFASSAVRAASCSIRSFRADSASARPASRFRRPFAVSFRAASRSFCRASARWASDSSWAFAFVISAFSSSSSRSRASSADRAALREASTSLSRFASSRSRICRSFLASSSSRPWASSLACSWSASLPWASSSFRSAFSTVRSRSRRALRAFSASSVRSAAARPLDRASASRAPTFASDSASAASRSASCRIRASTFDHCAFRSVSFSLNSPALPARFRRSSTSPRRRDAFSRSCSAPARAFVISVVSALSWPSASFCAAFVSDRACSRFLNIFARSLRADSRSFSRSVARRSVWSRIAFRFSASSASRASSFVCASSISRRAAPNSRSCASNFSWRAVRERSRAASPLLRPSRDATSASTSPSRFRRASSFVSSPEIFFSTFCIVAPASAREALVFRSATISARAASSCFWAASTTRFASRSAAVCADPSSLTRRSRPSITSSWRAICAPFASESLRASCSSFLSCSSRAFASDSMRATSTWPTSDSSASSADSPAASDFRAFSRSPIRSQLEPLEDAFVEGELLGLREVLDLVCRQLAEQLVEVLDHDLQLVPQPGQLLRLLRQPVPLLHHALHLVFELHDPALQLRHLEVRGLDRDRRGLGPPRRAGGQPLLELPPPPLDVDLGLAHRMMPLIEEPRLLAEQFLALLELALLLLQSAHERPELALPSDDVRLPFLELPERLLPRLELAPERLDPTPERGLAGLQLVLLHPQDVPIGVLHVDEALFELEDVLLLDQEVLD